ncbi:CHAT domain-containing protein [Aspergillus cavernicola]|uniref:CHAT domain-containing protein n=1 Tax=Aspergillus cavernicola TaxID=176166 RepID=A0ABR4HBF4_9EURO
MADLDIAIRRLQEALDRLPDNHPDRASRLRDLGAGYYERYYRVQQAEGYQAASIPQLKALEDLNMAIQRLQEALDLTPDNHPDRASQLQNLGLGHYSRYQRSVAQEDLDMAIQRFQEALDLTQHAHPDRASRLEHLGLGYHAKYQRILAEEYRVMGAQPSEPLEELDTAIQKSQEALDLTPENHPDRARRLRGLGIAYHGRYTRIGAQEDLDIALQRDQEALNHSPSPPLDRLASIWSLVYSYVESENWTLAYQAASTAIPLISLISPLSLANSDKRNLVQVVGLASDTAAFALMLGKPVYEAIRLLELGRGAIIASHYELRADISSLQQQHPQLAEEFLSLRNQLDRPTDPTYQVNRLNAPTAPRRRIDQHHNAGQKLKQIMADIRKLPGFERFLLIPTEDEMKASAASGPIVILNTSCHRCDALIVEESGFRAVRLPRLYSDEIWIHAKALKNPKLLDIKLLEWLWDTIAEPVLDALGWTETPLASWPRIWWIPTGDLIQFPIHAAGYHSRGGDATVLDRAISSYSSSMRALVRSWQSQGNAQRPGKAILVGMPELRHAPREVETLERICSSMELHVVKPRPYQQDVLSALSACEIFHFAGHGQTNFKDPSESSLVLCDGPLSVATLFKIKLSGRKPFLAYLSACGTGQVKQGGYLDESLHLIAGCQLAGFRHVIGTLWEVDDELCVDVASITYDWMRREGVSDESVSEGLHHASRDLRCRWISENTARGVRNQDRAIAVGQSRSRPGEARDARDVVLCDDIPLCWIPYVHYGL